LILLRRPLVMFLYQGGEFNARSTELVAWALLFYAAGLLGHSIVEIVSRAFYALHDTRTPVGVGVAAMTLNIALSLLFSRAFAAAGWMPHGGLALANSLATSLEAVVLLILLGRRLNGLEARRVLAGALLAGLAALAMSLALAGWLAWAGNARPALVTLGGVAAGAGVYAAALFALRVPELAMLWNAALRRLRRSA
jgi:putative peptidoglycan lipid II flippase